MKTSLIFILLSVFPFYLKAQEHPSERKTDSVATAPETGLALLSSSLFVVEGDTLRFAELDSTRQQVAKFKKKQQSQLLYNQAVALMSQKPDSALRLLAQSTDYDSSFALPYLSRGNILMLQNKNALAEVAFEEALLLDDELITAYLGLARLAQADNEHTAAVQHLNHALKMEDKNVQCRYYRGVSHFVLGAYGQALVDFKAATQNSPTMAHGFNDLGSAHRQLGQLEEALNAYDQALALDPKMAFAFNNRGSLQLQMGNTEKAIADYSEAIKLAPKNALHFNNRGHAYYKSGKFKEAIADFNESLRLNPEYAFAFNNRASSYFKLEAYQKAVEDCNRAININPDYGYAYLNRGNAKEMLRDAKGACEDWQKAVHLGIESAKAYLSQCDDPFLKMEKQ